MFQFSPARTVDFWYLQYWINTLTKSFQISKFRRVLYVDVFFWVIPWRLNFICRRFGTLSVPSSWAGRYRMTDLSFYTYLPMKMK